MRSLNLTTRLRAADGRTRCVNHGNILVLFVTRRNVNYVIYLCCLARFLFITTFSFRWWRLRQARGARATPFTMEAHPAHRMSSWSPVLYICVSHFVNKGPRRYLLYGGIPAPSVISRDKTCFFRTSLRLEPVIGHIYHSSSPPGSMCWLC